MLERQKINAMLRRFCKLQESNDLVDLPADWNRWAVDIIGSEALLRRYEEWLSVRALFSRNLKLIFVLHTGR